MKKYKALLFAMTLAVVALFASSALAQDSTATSDPNTFFYTDGTVGGFLKISGDAIVKHATSFDFKATIFFPQDGFKTAWVGSADGIYAIAPTGSGDKVSSTALWTSSDFEVTAIAVSGDGDYLFTDGKKIVRSGDKGKLALLPESTDIIAMVVATSKDANDIVFVADEKSVFIASRDKELEINSYAVGSQDALGIATVDKKPFVVLPTGIYELSFDTVHGETISLEPDKDDGLVRVEASTLRAMAATKDAIYVLSGDIGLYGLYKFTGKKDVLTEITKPKKNTNPAVSAGTMAIAEGSETTYLTIISNDILNVFEIDGNSYTFVASTDKVKALVKLNTSADFTVTNQQNGGGNNSGDIYPMGAVSTDQLTDAQKRGLDSINPNVDILGPDSFISVDVNTVNSAASPDSKIIRRLSEDESMTYNLKPNTVELLGSYRLKSGQSAGAPIIKLSSFGKQTSFNVALVKFLLMRLGYLTASVSDSDVTFSTAASATDVIEVTPISGDKALTEGTIDATNSGDIIFKPTQNLATEADYVFVAGETVNKPNGGGSSGGGCNAGFAALSALLALAFIKKSK